MFLHVSFLHVRNLKRIASWCIMLYHQFSGTLGPFLGVAITILCLEKRNKYFGGFVTSCCRNATTIITSPHITTMRSESTLKARKPMKGICRPRVAEVSQWEIHDLLGESIWNMFHFGVPWSAPIPGWKADRRGPIEPLGPCRLITSHGWKYTTHTNLY